MRSFKQDDKKYNPTAQRFHVESMILTDNALGLGDAARIYFNHIPQIEVGQLVGLFVQGNFFGIGNNITSTTPIPLQSLTMTILTGFNNLFVTIVNKKGETLFSQIPYCTLFPVNGRIKPYNAVDIDSRKSYFSFSPGVSLTGPLTAQIGFLMQYQ
jgi:hypothetical protein